MKFIRDIITEKRGGAPGPAVPPLVETRYAPPDPAPMPAALAEEPAAYTANLFQDDDDGFAMDAAADARWPDPEPPRQPVRMAPQAPSPFDRLRSQDAMRAEADSRPLPDALARPPQQDLRLRAALAGGETLPTPAPVEPVPQTLSDMPYVSAQPAPRPDAIDAEMPPPAAGRGANRSGRVKTRLLGFNPEGLGAANPFEQAEAKPDAFPMGWLVVVSGPGRGASFTLHDGVSRVGRGEDQTVCLNFGDNAISRENHVSIAFDSEQSAFYIGQSGRSNIVRLNNKPLLSTEQIRHGDQIRVGETTLRLVALCSETFSWAEPA